MSTRYNPSIVRDSFALYVDAANVKSYPGSGTTWKDISGKGNDGTLTNGPTFSSDYGGKFNFDESNDYVDCGNILPQTAYTKSAWFRPESATRNIISGTSNHAFWMANTDNTLAAGHQGVYTRVSHALPSGNMLNQWWNGVVTWNDSTGWVLYLNGVQVDTSPHTTGPGGNSSVYIARFGGGNYFDGDIAQAIIYDRVLTATEVLQNYNAFKGRFGL